MEVRGELLVAVERGGGRLDPRLVGVARIVHVAAVDEPILEVVRAADEPAAIAQPFGVVLVDGGFLEGRTSEYRSLYSFSHC